ncbi:MAG TPA: hypothetical protein VGN44_19825 [Candidatus Angelobacter sp.]|jgi:hypothetical protein
MAYQTFQLNKTGPTLNVTFNPPFAKPPVVIVTSSLMGGTRMDSVETVTAISTTGATIVSGNQASNYFVNVLAIDVDSQSVNGLPVIAGSAPKTGNNLNIQMSQPPLPSVNLVSPFWQGSNGGVGGVETVIAETSSGTTVTSGNMAASNYFAEYVNAALNVTAGVQAGIVNKQGTVQRVYFTRQWLTPPYVFVSPWYTSGVGNVEFITAVTDTYFEVTSGNHASNYFVSWMAVPGPNANFTPPAGPYGVTVNDGSAQMQATLTLTVFPGGALAPTAMWANPSTATPSEVPVSWDGRSLTWMGADHVYGPGVWNGSQFAGNYQHKNGYRGKRTNGNWTAIKNTR